MQLERRCITCPTTVPVCNCPPTQRCLQSSQNCDACATFTCVANSSTSPEKSGVSKGALAGAIVGVITLLATVVFLLWFLHKRRRARELARQKALEPKPEVPAPAAAVLSRPDPNEKPRSPSSHVRVYSAESSTTINLVPAQHPSPADGAQNYDPSLARSNASSSFHNPFADQSSIITSSTQDQSNVIPIALVPYGSVQSPPAKPSPARPAHSPGLVGNAGAYDLAHVNVSNDSVPSAVPASAGRIAPSTRSDATRASYLSTGTYATDLFNETPAIVTRQQGRILGLSKAQVVEMPTPSDGSGRVSHLSPNSARLSRIANGRSPLAQSSFTPADIAHIDEQHAQPSPFADVYAPSSLQGDSAPARPLGDEASVRTAGTFGSHSGFREDDTQNSAINASILNARRVVVAPGSSLARANSVNSATTKPSSIRPPRFSFASEASSRADSILEAFPFVPPSPISEHSIRSEQRSLQSLASSRLAEPPNPPDRRTLALSTMSGASTASTGLEPFSFQFSDNERDSRPRGAHASLDTLALTRDLNAFPLAYDEDTDHSASSQNPSRQP